MLAETRAHTDVVSSSHLFRHLSFPSETDFVKHMQATSLPKKKTHPVFRGPVLNLKVLIDFVKCLKLFFPVFV